MELFLIYLIIMFGLCAWIFEGTSWGRNFAEKHLHGWFGDLDLADDEY